MGCGCGRRAVGLLQKMGYVRSRMEFGEPVPDANGEWLIKGDERVLVRDAELHHARVTANAVRKLVADYVIGGKKNG